MKYFLLYDFIIHTTKMKCMRFVLQKNCIKNAQWVVKTFMEKTEKYIN